MKKRRTPRFRLHRGFLPLALCLAAGAPAAAQEPIPPDIERLLRTPPLSGGPDTPGWILAGQGIFYTGGNVGVGYSQPMFPLIVGSVGDRAVVGQSTAPSGIAYGGVFASLSPAGRGVYGLAAATSGTTYGVQGQSLSPDGSGLFGVVTLQSGRGVGVRGH